MSKTFYCMRCEEQVECEKEHYVVTGEIGADGYFCPMCGDQLDNIPDADATYEQLRDDEIFRWENES